MENQISQLSPIAFSDLQSALKEHNYSGKISSNLTDRIAVSTDNSIYQVIPEIVIKPDQVIDAQIALKVLNQAEFDNSSIAVRAGGTGTNGQSLNNSIVLDLGKHLNKVREFNKKENWIEVDSGIVLKNLNDILKPHNLFFAPTTSTANRCSIGGMIGTDAAGKGSRIYGKTSDHVLGLDILLPTGERLWLEPKKIDELGDSQSDQLCKQIYEICNSKRDQIKKTFPRLNRRLSGYDIETCIQNNSIIDPTRILCGSEGTLGIILGARLKLTPIPKSKKLVVLAYKDFIDAVSSAQDILPFEPSAIETIDDVIQEKAMEGELGKLLPEDFQNCNGENKPICNFVEFSGNDENQLKNQVNKLIEFAHQNKNILSLYVAKNTTEQKGFWEARKAAVGLLANCPPGPQPAAFVEDCVVPPENLASFLSEFRTLLDNMKMSYGMFGHVDVGCIHVRPALNMHKTGVAQHVREISDNVQSLVRKYDGLLWGEHGKGYRGEYLKDTVGEEIYDIMREIKTLFDPNGRLNPGKLAIPKQLKTKQPIHQVTKIDEAPLRARRNREVTEENRLDKFSDAFRCNGNSQCLNTDQSLHMCPSYKATDDLRYSPKGRADLLREWLRRLEKDDHNLADFEKELYPVMDACLSCKACTSSCPVKVDIPELKSRFLENYHTKHSRPLRDNIFARLENYSHLISQYPSLANLVMQNPIAKQISSWIGIIDAPKATTPSIHKRLQKHHAKIWSPSELRDALTNGITAKPPKEASAISPIILVDGFNLTYDAQSIEDIYAGLCKLGFYPFLVYSGPSGKALHVKGYRKKFKEFASKNITEITQLTSTNLPLIVAESSYLTTITKDFKAINAKGEHPDIIPLHTYLLKHLQHFNKIKLENINAKYFSHCTEKTSMKDVSVAWQTILKSVGANVKIISSGCCGMSGAYGHEAPHQISSKKLYDLTWKAEIDSADNELILASGFSCRCQVKRYGQKEARHPLASLLA